MSVEEAIHARLTTIYRGTLAGTLAGWLLAVQEAAAVGAGGARR